MTGKSPTFATVLHGLLYILLSVFVLALSLPASSQFLDNLNWSAIFCAVLLMIAGICIIFQRGIFSKRKIIPNKYYMLAFFLILVIFIRAFILEPTRISSNSMLPTFKLGDYILIKKYSFGLRMPFFDMTFFINRKPSRGEVVVFRHSNDHDNYYIKRLIGLPGDVITYHDNILVINDEPVNTKPDGKFRYNKITEENITINRFVEYIGQQSHRILDGPSSLHAVNSEWVVPEKHYFFLGDNRDDSNDSRFLGFVSAENIIGKPTKLYIP